jgi:hypothetical protein
MPYLPHWRATTHFSLGPAGTPKEEATCTLNFSPGVLDTWSSSAQSVANDMFTDWSAWMVATDSKVSNHVRLDGLKLYSVGTNGRIDEDPVEAEVAAPVAGYVNAGTHPWQVSMVMTLVAGTRGKGRFGRIYLPPQGFSIDNSGLVSSSELSGMFNTTKTLLTALSNRPGLDTDFKLVVAGRTGTGTLRPVTQVKMGRVADTQRRRRRSLDEAYLVGDFEG